MSRVQLALNVRDLDAAVAFYRSLFGVEPALKLVLIEDPDARGHGVTGTLNHLDVEVDTPDEVSAAAKRLTGEGLDTLTQDATTCCYPVQDKTSMEAPR